MGSDNRQRTRLIGVRVNESEKQAITQHAADCGLSPGTFLRHLGLEYQVKGVIDQRAVRELLQVNADLGRLGGLLKWWLTDDERRPALELSALSAKAGNATRCNRAGNKLVAGINATVAVTSRYGVPGKSVTA